ncbi:MAG: hypothetical protein WC657_08120, partial [Candidatus Paceibacterota bacterium]
MCRFKLACKSLLFLLGIILYDSSLFADERRTLPDVWRIQPAVNSAAAPDDKDWGTTRSEEWRQGNIDCKGTSWEKKPRAKINSLWYEQFLKVPSEWQGKKVALFFDRLEGDAIVFMNGVRIAELLRPGGEVDCTAHVKFGLDNELRVFMTRDYTDISRKFEQDSLRYICRTVESSPILMDRWPMG